MLVFGKIVLGVLAIVSFACGIASSGKTTDNSEITPAEEAYVPKDVQTAVFAGGCFWGVEAVFEHVKGVIDVKSGYAGGDEKTAKYDLVSNGETDHAEAVIVKFDPAKVSYTQLLTIFFSVAHDPTQLDRQGPDVGRHYRSEIFFTNEDQKKTAASYIEAVEKAKVLEKPIVTRISKLDKFYDAEGYHQDYMRKNPNQPYIVAHDRPKLEDLKKRFPDLYVKKY